LPKAQDRASKSNSARAESWGWNKTKEGVKRSSVGGTDVQAALSPYSLASRRRFLGTAGAAALALSPRSALADVVIKLPLPGGPDERSITTAFPQKGPLILQRTRPPLLETPVEVFDQSVLKSTAAHLCAESVAFSLDGSAHSRTRTKRVAHRGLRSWRPISFVRRTQDKRLNWVARLTLELPTPKAQVLI